jgi:hypothetical protein
MLQAAPHGYKVNLHAPTAMAVRPSPRDGILAYIRIRPVREEKFFNVGLQPNRRRFDWNRLKTAKWA